MAKQKQSFKRTEVVAAIGAKYRALSEQRHTLTESAVSEINRGNAAISLVYADKADELLSAINALRDVAAALGIDDVELSTI